MSNIEEIRELLAQIPYRTIQSLYAQRDESGM